MSSADKVTPPCRDHLEDRSLRVEGDPNSAPGRGHNFCSKLTVRVRRLVVVERELTAHRHLVAQHNDLDGQIVLNVAREAGSWTTRTKAK
jgi:hypothetical protein